MNVGETSDEILDDKVTSLFRYSLLRAIPWGIYLNSDSAYICNIGKRIIREAGSEVCEFVEKMNTLFQQNKYTKGVSIDMYVDSDMAYVRFTLSKKYFWKSLNTRMQQSTGATFNDGKRSYFAMEKAFDEAGKPVMGKDGKQEEKLVEKFEPVFYLLVPLVKPE